MKKITFFASFLLCMTSLIHAQKGVHKDYYRSAIKAIQTDNLAEFAANIKHINNIDSIIPLDSYHSYSLLGYACLYKNKPAIQKLIAMKANIDEVFSDEIFIYDALYMAIDNEDEGLVKQLLAMGADPNRPYNENGLCPLVASCNVNNIAIASLLLKHGAKADGVGNLGGDYIENPLITAVMKGNKYMVQLLLRYGAKKGVKDETGRSPLFYARQQKHSQIIKILEKTRGN
ncbi:ankyrin repeat domain-containing protein [Hoylesella loescheii]|jgi:ankyrin repeats containing protein|uniref:ankyrin repeat domain-containing protein n=1 Tax=Hoylesella loescheii TaxID=840 RepID=UPI0028EAD549|nr:ankyrin repeat domain-containing protein [Hoylesella loescheii]